MAKLNIGLKQAKLLCRMDHARRIEFISEGLPIILSSAQGFWRAATQLKDWSREADVLEGYAAEEAAKALMLVDAIRCPPSMIDEKISTIAGWFYSHPARLIYAAAQQWKPMDVKQLREYVDETRKAHYLDGPAGEYIMPNWEVYMRESQLYADIAAYEDGEPVWSAPNSHDGRLSTLPPVALEVAEALSAVGVFTRRGLELTSQVWGQLEFKDTESHIDAQRMTQQLLEQLVAENLPLETAKQEHVTELYRNWQLPMYNLDFRLIDVPLDELRETRDAMFWNEYGGY